MPPVAIHEGAAGVGLGDDVGAGVGNDVALADGVAGALANGTWLTWAAGAAQPAMTKAVASTPKPRCRLS
jgi:hypothetical protein